jgi:tetratricopeptide (TPR) repeat protein
MAKNEYAEQLGRAWTHHRQGRHDAAISEFQDLLREAPNQVDALFGLGLAQRGAKQHDAAAATFGKCLEAVERQLQEQPDDRYAMMRRLVQQRLAELKTQVDSHTKR